MTGATLSVIIPTLDEADNLPVLLEQLLAQSHCQLEILLADGGSRDGSREIIQQIRENGAKNRSRPHTIHWFETDKGRGRQMNAGARRANAPHLLFLHADSRLDDPTLLANALNALNDTRRRLGHDRIAGHFKLRFIQRPPGLKKAFHYYEEKSALNRPETTNGDQGFLLHNRFFQALGGFDETQPFLEDQKLAKRIRRQGVWMTLPGVLATSARRFTREGFTRRMILSALIMAFHAIEFQDFFDRAPGLYRPQEQTGKLPLLPFFRLVQRLNRQAGFFIAWRRWMAVGRYARLSAWQFFFLMDLIVAGVVGRRAFFLSFHDRLLAPLTDFWPFDLLYAGLIRLCFAGAALYFALTEAPHGPD